MLGRLILASSLLVLSGCADCFTSDTGRAAARRCVIDIGFPI